MDIRGEPNLETLGGRIRAVFTSRELNVTKTAEKVGLSRTTMSQWKSGAVKNPAPCNLATFAKLTEVSLDWLLNRDGADPDYLSPKRGRPRKQDEPLSVKGGRGAPSEISDVIPEINASLMAHASVLDLKPRALWAIPGDTLALAFHCEPGHLAMMRIIIQPPKASGLSRGDYVLLDASRTRIDEEGLYLLPDVGTGTARIAAVKMTENGLRVLLLAPDESTKFSETDASNVTALARIMGIYHPV